MVTRKQNFLKSKNIFTKLLAIENLQVVHDINADTAHFDTRSRTVTLPVLKDMREYVYDAFIGHEVAHAIYTPPNGFKEFQKQNGKENNFPFSYINIVEDARIEKLMKRKYPGLSDKFNLFYREFSGKERDFFGVHKKIAKEGIDSLKDYSLGDKFNLFFKIGKFIKIPLTPVEEQYIERGKKLETFEQVCNLAKDIYNYDKKENNLFFDKSVTSQSPENEETDEDCDAYTDNISIITQDDWNKNFSNNIVHVSKSSYKSFFGDVYDYSSHHENRIKSVNLTLSTNTYNYLGETNDKILKKFNDFQDDLKPTINMMVNYFNMKKSAKEYQKTQIYKTGNINAKKMTQFFATDDIFLRSEIVPEAKNHGLIMFIDWSGSMGGQTIYNTIKQTFVLTEFCNKLNIPYEIYGYTENSTTGQNNIIHIPNEYVFSDQRGIIFKLFDSSLRRVEYMEKAAVLLAAARKNYTNKIYPMGRTPIVHTAFLSEYVIKNFRKKTGVEKIAMILLSDGGCTDTINSDANHIYMRDKENFNIYDFERTSTTWHNIFKYVKDKTRVDKMIGFYLTEHCSGGIYSRYHDLCPEPEFPIDDKKLAHKFKKDNYAILPPGLAFDSYYLINIKNFDHKDIGIKMNKYDSPNRKIKNFVQQLEAMSKSLIFMKIFVDEIS